MSQTITLPAPEKFEISAERYRFDGASDALVAALAHEVGTTEHLEYAVAYSEGETDGWAVEVYRAGQRSYHLGNLKPVEVLPPLLDYEPVANPKCNGSCTLSFGAGTEEDPDRCVICDALFLRDASQPFAFAE